MLSSLGRQGITNVNVRARGFAPVEVPAVIVLEQETEAELRLQEMVSQPWFRQHLEEIRQEVVRLARRRPIHLTLNTRNPILQRLTAANVPGMAVEDLLFDVFVSAILYARDLVPLDDPDLTHKRFLRLLNTLLEQYQMNAAIQQTVERERRQMTEIGARLEKAQPNRPEHIVLFMITPFSDEYRQLEQAVRRVFERPPYCFEVLLARDHVHKPSLSENVREHIRQAHSFIADISDLNPNVMLELGAAMFADSDRPIFALRRTDAHELPADLKEMLFVPYDSLGDSLEDLESAVRDTVERDGRPAHNGVEQLLEQRRRLFLSKTLLKSLRTRLGDEECARLLGLYSTVEDLLAASATHLVESAGIPAFAANGVQGELHEVRRTLARE
jgi:hypothetical protein